MTREAIVAEARSWMGTPFRPQASLKGVGCDCRGLVFGVARALGLPEADAPFAQIADYDPARPDVRLLREGMAATFKAVAKDQAQPGDVLLLVTAGRAQHLAIYTGSSFVHAFPKGPAQVIETRCSRDWLSQVHSVWGWGSIDG